MHALQLIKSAIPFIGLAMNLAGVILLARRGLVSKFPVFWAFLYAGVLTFVVLWFSRRHPAAAYEDYFYSYWALATVNALLGFAVLWEAFRESFTEYKGLSRLWSAVFRWGALGLLALAILTAWMSPGTVPGRVIAAVLLLERSLRLVQVGLVAVLLVMAVYLRLSLPQPSFGIILGFGLYATVTLVTVSLMGRFGYGEGSEIIAWAKPLAYLCAAVVWLIAILSPQKAASSARLPRHELQGWNEALLRFLR